MQGIERIESVSVSGSFQKEPSVNDQRNEGEGVEEFLIILKLLHEIIKGWGSKIPTIL